ncbi:hypothetical protein [Sedimenticola selenatireducens]|uniref:Uncharacterized protein n=1 Tax=Sedimenticola selenatireducens TaxID=191960 RepID=A0A558DUG0_9GAMM|nr:hypothetical protein [Sedimenticola selenatireducens]TVO77090.1 hypothetical protein FHP88_06625 [Sedimenticola selenatireducens]TVT64533.1 MAG: hypothetical protein FHK78_09870 [Sedimenticola selenatireducens]
MNHFDDNVTEELREIRNKYIEDRWGQLHQLSKESGENAVKYLFTVNAGGAVTVLAYLGSVAGNGPASISAKLGLISFFLGLLFVGFYKAHMVHYHEGLFDHFQKLVRDYYDEKIGWNNMHELDQLKIGEPKLPYVYGYLSFSCFVFGCISGGIGIF